MSATWYDNAIVEMLRVVTGDDRIALTPVGSLFRYIANHEQDKIIFPLIGLARLGYTLGTTTRSPMTYDGVAIGSKGGMVDKIQCIPCQINYQLDIITRSRADNDAITEELIFYLVNHPTLEVDIGRGANVSHKFSLFYEEEVVDNSDIESHLRNGEYFRSTMRLFTDDAKLWKTTNNPIKRIHPVTLIGTSDFNDPSKDYIKDVIDIEKSTIVEDNKSN